MAAIDRKTALTRNSACLTCRQRKKKCDGRQPICDSCSRLGYQCRYSAVRSATRDHRTSASPSSGSNSTYYGSPNGGITALVQSPDQLCLPSARYPTVVPSGDSMVSVAQALETVSQHDLDIPGCVSPITASSNYSLPPFESDYFTTFPFQQFLEKDLLEWDQMLVDAEESSHTNNVNTPNTSISSEYDSGRSIFPTPSSQIVLNLHDIFFNTFHQILPTLHKETYSREIESNGIPMEEHVLLLSVLAVASTSHPDSAVKAQGRDWVNRARKLIDEAVKAGSFSSRHVQAGVWVTLYLFIMSEMSESWIFLGKTWRLACPLGLHRMDAKRRGYQSVSTPQNDQERSKEELRKTMWGLFILDRCLSFVCGWPFAIDDRQFMVNIPRDDTIFQTTPSERLMTVPSQPFPTSLEKIGGAIDHCYGFICQVAVLLGRIVDYNNVSDPEDDLIERKFSFERLETALARLHLSVPKQFSEINILKSPAEQDKIVWLACMLQTCSILLHHPTVRDSERTVSTGGHEQSAEFLRCLAGTKHIISALKELITASGRSLMNPLAGPIFFLCGRILIIHYLERKEIGTKNEIDIILLSLERMREVCEPLANKYKKLLQFDLARPPSSIRKIRTNDGSYMSTECAGL